MQFKSFMESFGKGKVTIDKPGHPMHGKTADVFYHHDDGRVNVQVRHSSKRGDISNLTLNKDQYKEVHKEEVELEEEQLDELKASTLKSYANKRMASFSREKGIMPGSKEHKQWKSAQKAYDKAAAKIMVPSQAREEVELEESLDEADVQARADYKLDKRGRKYHKQISFKDGSNDEANEKDEVREETDMNEEMTDAQKSERERIVKGMKKNIAGFKAKYGERAKEVMYATATKQAMKEETLEEGTHRVAVWTTEPNHEKAQKRDYQTQKMMRVTASSNSEAEKKAREHYEKQGNYKVHKVVHHGLVKEEIEDLQEGTQSHKVNVTVSDPNHTMVTMRKEKIAKRVVVSATDKGDALAKAKSFYQKKGYKVHDVEHHSVVPKTTLKTEEVELDEAKLGSEHTFHPGDVVNVHWHDISGKTSHGTTNVDKATSAYVHITHPNHGGAIKLHQGINGKGGHEVGTTPGTRSGGYVISKKTHKEEVELEEQLVERNKENATRRKMMDASRGARWKVQNKVSADDVRDWDNKHKTPQAQNKAIGRALRNEEAEDLEEGYRGNSEADKPYFDAQDHKAAAEQAHKKGDSFSYHMHMASHHDSLAHWSSNKGRHHVADQHAMKADQHHDWAQQARLKKEDITIEFDEEGNLMSEKLTYAQFMEQLLEYTPGPGGVTRVQGRSYGAQYHDPEGDDDADDKPKKKAEPAVKRGRGRPAGSKSGANQKVTSGKSYGGIATHSLHLPSSNR